MNKTTSNSSNSKQFEGASSVRAPYGGFSVEPEPGCNLHDVQNALRLWDGAYLQKAMRQSLPYEYFTNQQGTSFFVQALYQEDTSTIDVFLQQGYLEAHLKLLEKNLSDFDYLTFNNNDKQKFVPEKGQIPKCVLFFETFDAIIWHLENEPENTLPATLVTRFEHILQLLIDFKIDPQEKAPHGHCVLFVALKEPSLWNFFYLMSKDIKHLKTETIFELEECINSFDDEIKYDFSNHKAGQLFLQIKNSN